MRIKKFSPIIKEIIKSGEVYPFKIYRKLEDNSFLRLFNINETIPKNSGILKEDIIYIKSEDRSFYQKYLEEHINEIIDNETIKLDEKVAFLNDLASTTMESLFDEKISIKNVKKATQVADNLVDLMLEDDNAMFSILRVTSHDYYTYTHCIDVALYAIGFGTYLGLNKEDLTLLGKAAMLHDIGKKDIDKAIINKKGKLTEKEFEQMKQHPQLGVKALRLLGITNKTLLSTIEQHHEKCDGSGYPRGLKEEEILNFAKILTICDIFAAMTTRRSYKDRINTFNTLNIMVEEMKDELSHKYLKEFINFMAGEVE